MRRRRQWCVVLRHMALAFNVDCLQARARVIGNNTGHDTTAAKTFRWKHIRECMIDPCFWFAGINSFLGSVPNGGVTTMSSILMTTFGFSKHD